MLKQPPSPLLLAVFRVAALLKIVGVVTASITAQFTSNTWALNRWWMALVTGSILLILLLPLDWFRPNSSSKMRHTQLIAALAFALVSHHIDVTQSSFVAYDDLIANPQFMTLLGWSHQTINNVHGFGAMFTMVPVVLASWQYGVFGMFGSLGLAGALYVLNPLILPPDAFNWWYYTVRGFVLLGVTLILSFIVGTLASSQRRKASELAAANTRLAEQAAIMEQLATSRERNRLSRELHDTLAHSLSGTAVQLQAVGTLINVDSEAASAELKVAQTQIREGLTEARRAIAALRSSPLEELGLIGALEQRATNLSHRSEIPIQTKLDAVKTLPPLTEQTIYRIADEALVNAEKYAQADQITLSLTQSAQTLTLTIQDNGVGFDPATVRSGGRNGGRFGLISMRERAELINATLSIQSQIGQGTVISLAIAEPRSQGDTPIT